jgi:hypothetical protein
MDQADEIAPLVAVWDRSQRTPPIDTPRLVQDGLEPNAMLVDRSQLDGGVREGPGHLA